MNEQAYTSEFTVDQSPDRVHEAITHVTGWWSGNVQGETRKVGDVFDYSVPGIHFSRMEVVRSIPGREIEWSIVDSNLTYVDEPREWTGTRVRFEIEPKGAGTLVRFTHIGLVPSFECFEACSGAWTMLVAGNLRRLIETGEDQPDVFAS